MKKMRTARHNGFCLIELIGSMVILAGITGAVIAGISWYQRHSNMQATADLHAGARDVVASGTRKAAPAGALASPWATITSNTVTSSSVPQAVKVGSTAGLFAGEKVLVGQGTARETVAIKPLNSTTIRGVFAKNHASGAPVTPLGVSASPASGAGLPGAR